MKNYQIFPYIWHRGGGPGSGPCRPCWRTRRRRSPTSPAQSAGARGWSSWRWSGSPRPASAPYPAHTHTDSHAILLLSTISSPSPSSTCNDTFLARFFLTIGGSFAKNLRLLAQKEKNTILHLRPDLEIEVEARGPLCKQVRWQYFADFWPCPFSQIFCTCNSWIFLITKHRQHKINLIRISMLCIDSFLMLINFGEYGSLPTHFLWSYHTHPSVPMCTSPLPTLLAPFITNSPPLPLPGRTLSFLARVLFLKLQ